MQNSRIHVVRVKLHKLQNMEITFAVGKKGQAGNSKSIESVEKASDDLTSIEGVIKEFDISKGNQSLYILTVPKNEFKHWSFNLSFTAEAVGSMVNNTLNIQSLDEISQEQLDILNYQSYFWTTLGVLIAIETLGFGLAIGYIQLTRFDRDSKFEDRKRREVAYFNAKNEFDDDSGEFRRSRKSLGRGSQHDRAARRSIRASHKSANRASHKSANRGSSKSGNRGSSKSPYRASHKSGQSSGRESALPIEKELNKRAMEREYDKDSEGSSEEEPPQKKKTRKSSKKHM